MRFSTASVVAFLIVAVAASPVNLNPPPAIKEFLEPLPKPGQNEAVDVKLEDGRDGIALGRGQPQTAQHAIEQAEAGRGNKELDSNSPFKDRKEQQKVKNAGTAPEIDPAAPGPKIVDEKPEAATSLKGQDKLPAGTAPQSFAKITSTEQSTVDDDQRKVGGKLNEAGLIAAAKAKGNDGTPLVDFDNSGARPQTPPGSKPGLFQGTTPPGSPAGGDTNSGSTGGPRRSGRLAGKKPSLGLKRGKILRV